MTIALAGVTVHVTDVERSLAFYRQLPGATLVFHLPSRFALLQFGNGRLGILADSQRQFHVELEVPELDAMAVTLRELGVDADGPTTRPWGERDILVRDPDGYLLEFAAGRAHDAS
jgi:catechol 2,3-dioxygenase-like lactoylglutathione lyase family enzyme